MAPTSRSATWLVALGVGAFQVIGSFGAADNQPERRPIGAVAVVLLLAGPAALARRDRWPLPAVVVSSAAAVLYAGLGYPYGPVFASVAVAFFTAVQAGHRRATWVLATAAYLAFVVASVVDDRADLGVLHLALVGGWLAVVLAVSEVVRGRRKHAAHLAEAEREQRQRGLAEQRLTLAQDLHDVLAHNISLINVQASVALHLIDDRPDQARPALTSIKDASHEALQELRAALDLLRRGDDAAPRAPAPGLSDLQPLVAGVRAGGVDVRLEQAEPPGPLPAAVELAAFRIVQEALTNVTRHAGAGGVTVRMAYGDGVRVEVVDDGTGGAVGPPGTGATSGATTGNGIVGMRERATALGGTLEAGPQPGGGWAVRAHLPVGLP